MPKYDIECDHGHKHEVPMTFAVFDEIKDDMQCPDCKAPAHVVFDVGNATVAIFTGSGWTRRTTDPRSSRGIDHHDWRMQESWPGPVEKKVERARITNWTADDFRRGAI